MVWTFDFGSEDIGAEGLEDLGTNSGGESNADEDEDLIIGF